MTDSRYNGWTNYETWNLKLWIDNDQGEQEYWEEQTLEALQRAIDDDESDVKDAAASALADMLESVVSEDMPKVSGFYSDVLGAALRAVDYREIAVSMVGDIEVYSAGWNMPGYMPDCAPSMFLAADDARDYIADEIERAAEDFAEYEAADVSVEADAAHSIAEDCRKGSGEFGQTIGKFHYFVARV